MKVKFRILGYVSLKDNKGTLVNLETQFGERMSSYVSASKSLLDIKSEYPENAIFLCDVVAYRNKSGEPALGVNLPSTVSESELF